MSSSLPASWNFCRLLITYANGLYQDQALEKVRPDLDSQKNFMKKYKKNQRQTKKHPKNKMLRQQPFQEKICLIYMLSDV